jgi:hypothetical protein
MKKIALLLVFVLIGSFAFAQSVLSTNGNDWVRWTSMEKQMYTTGWLSSLDALMQLAEYWQENYELTEASTNVLNAVTDWAFYKNVGTRDLVILLDRAYSDPAVRKFEIWDVLLTLNNKEWW